MSTTTDRNNLVPDINNRFKNEKYAACTSCDLPKAFQCVELNVLVILNC